MATWFGRPPGRCSFLNSLNPSLVIPVEQAAERRDGNRSLITTPCSLQLSSFGLGTA
jgi:hypothetical protein